MAGPRVPTLDVVELQRRLGSEPKPFLLDVREPWEYGAAHVPDAILIPLGELDQRVGEVPRDRPVMAICQSGQRSLLAAAYLQRLGYSDVSNVDGGTAAWMQKGYPTSR